MMTINNVTAKRQTFRSAIGNGMKISISSRILFSYHGCMGNL